MDYFAYAAGLARRKLRFLDYCGPCIQQTHVRMMTGYCLTSLRCDRCSRISDLAMVDTRTIEGSDDPAAPRRTGF